VLSGLELPAWQLSGFVQTGQKINSQLNVQVPVQNCIIIQYFVNHTMHGVKGYQIIFPTHLVPCHLDIPSWSYDQNIDDHSEDQKMCRN
jgi:hypothetical protein